MLLSEVSQTVMPNFITIELDIQRIMSCRMTGGDSFGLAMGKISRWSTGTRVVLILWIVLSLRIRPRLAGMEEFG